ncbi:PAS domain S-box protein [Verrucomicrobiota bacterium]
MFKIDRCATTMIGSAPYASPDDAFAALDQWPLSIPAWPQLPKRSFRETMIPQYSESFPGITFDDAEGKVFVDLSRDLLTDIGAFYENALAENANPFAITGEHALGLRTFLDRLARDGTRLPVIKGQVTGPFTYGLGLNDQDGKAVWFDPEYRDVVLKGLTMKALWQIGELGKLAENVVIFFDEPILSALGTPAYMTIQDEDVLAALNEVINAAQAKGAKVGVHCCGNMDWSLLARTDVDIMSFDAYFYGEKLALYPREIDAHLAKGGYLAWGIVPTAGHTAEERLRESEEKYRTFVERANDGIAIVQDGVLKFVNRRLAEMLGHPVSDLLDASMLDYIPPENHAHIGDMHKRRLAGEDVPDLYEMRAIRSDGSIIHIETNASVITLEGQPAVLAFLRDISDRKLVEVALREGERHLKDAQALARVGHWRLDTETREVTGSDELFRIFGITREEGTLDAFVEIVHPDDREYDLSHIRRGMEQAEPWDIEHRLLCRDGTLKYVQAKGEARTDESGKVVELMGTVQDITEREQVAEKLEQNRLLFRSMIENAGTVVLLLSPDYTIIEFNGAAESLYGKKRSDVVGKNYLEEFLPADVRDAVVEDIQEVLAGKTTHDFENEIVRSDGTRRMMSWSSSRVPDPRGVAVGVIAIGVDITDRKRAERELRESKEEYQRLVENIPSVAWTTDERGHTSFISPNVERVYGYTPEEIYGGGEALWLGRIHPEDIDNVRRAFGELMEAGERFDVEYRIQHKNGHWIWLRDQADVIQEEGPGRCAYGVFSDITERKRVEEALRRERGFSQTVLRASPGFFVAVNPDGRTIMMNPAMLSAVGYSADEVIGKDYLEMLVPEREHAHVRQVFDQLEDEHRPSLSENSVLTKDGREILVEWHGAPVFGKDGEFDFFFGFGTDITTRKQAAEQLRRSEEHYRTLVENMPSVLFTFDREGRFLSWNSAAEEVYGYSEEEAVGATAYDLIVTPDTKDATDEVIAQVFAGKSVVGAEWQDRNKKGKVGWRMGNAFPLFKPDGLVECGVNMNVDITERKNAELELQRALSEIRKLKELVDAENLYLREEIRMSHLHGDIVGQSDAMKSVLAQAEQVAVTDSTVLILGETGTGKELFARAIHNMSQRKDKPLVVVNCAAMPSTLIESELFGREKGAYTGALTRQVGRFEVANGSTIFLDEIGELSPELQAKLLRVIQEGQFERLGSTATISVDVRVIAATNRDMEKEVAEGQFREDLFYRLNVFPITLPPLRERRDDIPVLAWAFVNELGEKMGKRIENIPRKGMEALQNHTWPGNVRELRNAIERGMIRTKGKTLQVQSPARPQSAAVAGEGLDEVERQHIITVLERTNWRIRGNGGAAEALGLKPTTLDSRMKKLGIKRPT